MIALLAIAAGGFVGGAARYLLSVWPGGRLGTWLANTVACALLGAAVLVSGPMYALVAVGCAGALSTWSTLAAEIGGLLVERRWLRAAGYTIATIVAGWTALMVLAAALT